RRQRERAPLALRAFPTRRSSDLSRCHHIGARLLHGLLLVENVVLYDNSRHIASLSVQPIRQFIFVDLAELNEFSVLVKDSPAIHLAGVNCQDHPSRSLHVLTATLLIILRLIPVPLLAS